VPGDDGRDQGGAQPITPLLHPTGATMEGLDDPADIVVRQESAAVGDPENQVGPLVAQRQFAPAAGPVVAHGVLEQVAGHQPDQGGVSLGHGRLEILADRHLVLQRSSLDDLGFLPDDERQVDLLRDPRAALGVREAQQRVDGLGTAAVQGAEVPQEIPGPVRQARRSAVAGS